MQKNKFTTYLLYAIGEIVLVVIGILIAVSINNWNIEQKNRVREQYIIANILEDLEKDRDEIVHVAAATFRQISLGVSMLSDLGDNYMDALKIHVRGNGQQLVLERFLEAQHETDLSEWSLAEKMIHFRYRTFDTYAFAFEEIQSNGELTLIQDSTIRKKIINYYAKTSDLEDIHVFIRAANENYQRILLDSGLPDQRKSAGQVRLNPNFEAIKASIKNQIRAMFQVNGPFQSTVDEAAAALIMDLQAYQESL